MFASRGCLLPFITSALLCGACQGAADSSTAPPASSTPVNSAGALGSAGSSAAPPVQGPSGSSAPSAGSERDVGSLPTAAPGAQPEAPSPNPVGAGTTPGAVDNLDPASQPAPTSPPAEPQPDVPDPGEPVAPDEPAPDPPAAEPEPTQAWYGATASALDDARLQQEYADWKSRLVEECPNDASAVVVKDGGQVVSEGIAYGMLISVNMDDQALFDKLWKFYLDHVDDNGMMNWSMGVCEAPGNNDANAATDAELDAAMALVQAAARWGGTYLTDAEDLAAKIIEHETDVCDGRTVILPGDIWGGCNDLNGETRINPSYFAPGYYRVFAAKFPTQSETWNALLEGTYELYPVLQERMMGLFPDWSDYDGSDWYGSTYNYDACRTPWRIATDYAWSGDERALTALSRVADVVSGDIPVGAYPNNSAFQGAFALASIDDAATLDADVASWLSSGGDDNPYFQATLRLLYMLVAAGRFPSTL